MIFERIFRDYENVEREKSDVQNEMSTMLKYLYGENFPDSNFCKLKGLSNLEKHYFSHPEMSVELRKHLQEKFTTNFSMSERKQIQVMKSWLTYM